MNSACLTYVIPAKAGIQGVLPPGTDSVWIPAFAGMTRWEDRA
jgi:hypothetical protein